MNIFECDLPALTTEDVQHILVVDDDERLRDLLRTYLSKQDWMVSVAADAAEARTLLSYLHCDVMILDVMMPGETGIAYAKSLKLHETPQHPPILMLTAMSEPEDRILGLETGVDDYLSKPFEPRELVLRIQAILRRTRQEKKQNATLQFGHFNLDSARKELTQHGEIVHLTDAEMTMLLLLAQHVGTAVSRETLMSGDASGTGGERSVDVQITRLRRRIEEDPSRPRYIQTIRGAGYMLKV